MGMSTTIESSVGCALCGREKPLTFHHLIPRKLHGKPRFKKRHSKEELRSRGIDICRLCHDGLHALLTERELGETYHTLDLLREHAGVAKHVAWVRKQK